MTRINLMEKRTTERLNTLLPEGFKQSTKEGKATNTLRISFWIKMHFEGFFGVKKKHFEVFYLSPVRQIILRCYKTFYK